MKIVIQGCSNKGREVIQILESLGGKNQAGLFGYGIHVYYYIKNSEIYCDVKCNVPPGYKLYTLEEFEKEFPFKIGDKVIVLDYSNKKEQ